MMEGGQEKGVSILMMPHLAHGHVSPYFELAKRLSNKGFQIYFCSTPICLEFIRKKHNKLSSSSNIQLVDIQILSSFHQELPPHFHSTQNVPPHLTNTLKSAFDASQPAFSDILKTLRPDLVIYDLLQPWAGETARELNIEAVLFLIFGGVHTSLDEESSASEDMDQVVNGNALGERCFRSFSASKMVLVKSCRQIGGKNVTSTLAEREMVGVGPLIQKPEDISDICGTEIMDWLSKKKPSSVIYVCFGSECFLSQQELEEMAYGLELSKFDFIWVVRSHGGSNKSIHEALPEGFLERIEGRGMIVDDWVPQAKILAHASIGGFVSHCGWSSTLEALMQGVPLIALPMGLDQPLTAKLVVDVGLAIAVPRMGKKFVSENLASVIRKVVVEEEGKEVRRRVKELSQRLREEEDEELNEAVEKLLHLVHQSRN